MRFNYNPLADKIKPRIRRLAALRQETRQQLTTFMQAKMNRMTRKLPTRYILRRAPALWSCNLGIVLSLFMSGAAAQLYKYQDKEGIWHYSDSPPPDQRDLRPSVGKPVSADQQVIIHRLGEQDAPVFEVSNKLPTPIELEFTAKELLNMRAVPPLPIRKVIPAGSREPLTRFEKVRPESPWNYVYASRFVPGDPAAQHLTGKPYLPPFSSRKEFTISQAFDGKQSHQQHPLTRYAVDIPMPGGSSVHAARSGKIVEIARGRLSPQRKSKTFYIRILHRDGTFGLYANLDPASVNLHPGAEVNRGQVVGLLGKETAGEDSPYLHFAVQKNTGMQLESIPFAFTNLDGLPQEPKAGLLLRHPL